MAMNENEPTEDETAEAEDTEGNIALRAKPPVDEGDDTEGSGVRF